MKLEFCVESARNGSPHYSILTSSATTTVTKFMHVNVSPAFLPSCAAAIALVIKHRSFFALALVLSGRSSMTLAKTSADVLKMR
jgi:hypothetical protein